MGLYVWTLGHQLLVLFGKITKPLEGRGLLEKVHYRGEDLRFYSLILLPAIFLLPECAYDIAGFLFLLPCYAPLHWKHKPKQTQACFCLGQAVLCRDRLTLLQPGPLYVYWETVGTDPNTLDWVLGTWRVGLEVQRSLSVNSTPPPPALTLTAGTPHLTAKCLDKGGYS